VDPYRAATHNKGIMNGIDAVVVATGNDWRSVEAGAHAFAARNGAYTSLSRWWLNARGDLAGSLEVPLALGTVGGGTRAFPAAAAALKILGVAGAGELAEIAVCVGLAQNLSALRALAAEGIQSGHMALHARQIAVAAGARGAAVARIADQMVAEGAIRASRARELVDLELRRTG
jgi:hydroxymethylglutaryl-CoA reductase